MTETNTLEVGALSALREELQRAIEAEHAVIPPYLCALYSLDRSVNPGAASVVEGIAVEAMMHLATAANLLNAVGGHPSLDTVDLLPGYPMVSPALSLLPFGTEAMAQLERVSPPVYERIDRALATLCADRGEAAVFVGDPALQVGGAVTPIADQAGARAALRSMVDENDARPPRLGRLTARPEGVRPMQPDPRLDDQVAGHPIRAAQEDFNQEYCALLSELDVAFNGEPKRLNGTFELMYGLRATALGLMEMRVPGTAYVAGPTFEYVDPEERW